MNKIRIAIFGHYGHKNYGDESIITATLENLRKHIPDAQLVCFSLDPEDSQKNHGVESFPIRKFIYDYEAKMKQKNFEKNQNGNEAVQHSEATIKTFLKKIKPLVRLVRLAHEIRLLIKIIPTEISFLKESYRLLDNIDLLLITGSNQFLDNFGGTWGFPYTLLKWTSLCKLKSKKFAFMSVGAGPLDKWLSKLFIRISILGSSYLSYRDTKSKILIEKTVFPMNGDVYPDLAHSISFVSAHNMDMPKTIGINPMPVYDKRYWYVEDDTIYNSYINRMVQLIQKIQDDGYKVFLFNTMEKDVDVAVDILNALPGKSKKTVENKMVNSVTKLMETIDTADLIIPTRYHGVILSLVAEKPVLGISYYRKTRDILREMGQEKYAVDIEDFTVDRIYASFCELVKNFSQEKTKIINKNEEYRRKLGKQYSIVKKLLVNE